MYDTNYTTAIAGISTGTMIIALIPSIILIIAMWKVFDKAVKPGWLPLFHSIILIFYLR